MFLRLQPAGHDARHGDAVRLRWPVRVRAGRKIIKLKIKDKRKEKKRKQKTKKKIKFNS